MRNELPAAIATGALVGVGLVLLIVSIVGIRPRDPAKPPLFGGFSNPRRSTIRLLIGLGVGLLTLVVTRWVVLAVALGGLAGGWSKVFGGAAEERGSIRRLEALVSWAESLRDTIAGAVGLEQAIPSTAATASLAIRPALNLLVDRLRIREPLPSALLRFADDMDDASADLVVGALVLNARLRGPGLRDVLTTLSGSAREELDVRRRVEATRRSTRRSVQIVVGVTLGVAAMLILLNRQYVQPYGSFVGQLILVVVIALFGAGVLWLRRLAHIEMPGRFLGAARADRAVRTGEAPAPGPDFASAIGGQR